MPDERKEVEDWLAGRGALLVGALIVALVVMGLVYLVV